MSLIHPAERHHIEPFHDLAAVALDPSAWMPWNDIQALAIAQSGPAAN